MKKKKKMIEKKIIAQFPNVSLNRTHSVNYFLILFMNIFISFGRTFDRYVCVCVEMSDVF